MTIGSTRKNRDYSSHPAPHERGLIAIGQFPSALQERGGALSEATYQAVGGMICGKCSSALSNVFLEVGGVYAAMLLGKISVHVHTHKKNPSCFPSCLAANPLSLAESSGTCRPSLVAGRPRCCFSSLPLASPCSPSVVFSPALWCWGPGPRRVIMLKRQRLLRALHSWPSPSPRPLRYCHGNRTEAVMWACWVAYSLSERSARSLVAFWVWASLVP